MKVASTKSGVDYAYFGTGIINSDEAQQALPGTKVVFLVDLATGVSVTNGAEAVVEEVSKSYPNYLICYRDTLGEWSELKVRDGAFLSFGPWCAGHPSNEDVETALREITPIN